jgi:hypothetical protein
LADNDDWTRKELEEQLASMRAVTVPVNVQIRGQQRIFVLSEMEEILKEAKLIALGECVYRFACSFVDSFMTFSGLFSVL